MAELTLRCKDKRFPMGDWLLSLGEGGVTLTDSKGTTRANFSRSEAESRFVLPSFWESVKDLGVRADSGDIVWFVPDGGDNTRIKTYLQSALAFRGPAAIRALRRRGWVLVIAGIFMSAVGVFVMAASMARASGNPGGGKYYVTIGFTIFGLFAVSRGMVNLSKARRADREADGIQRGSAEPGAAADGGSDPGS